MPLLTRRKSTIVLLAGLLAISCDRPQNSAATAENPGSASQTIAAEKPFAAGGSVEMRLDGGNYELRPAADDRIRVTVTGNAGGATTELGVTNTHANLAVTNTPHNNFNATIEVPKTVDLVVHLNGGNLSMAAITGNKDVDSVAGNTEIAIGDANDYASVDASVKAGNIDADVFGGSKSGLLQHFTWSGPGRHTLRANLGAGNLALRRSK